MYIYFPLFSALSVYVVYLRCGGCGHLIAKGVRFNADKKQIGNYFSTKIWSFKMRAPCCSAEIEVQTDPKNCEYNVVTGGRRKKEDYKAEDAQVGRPPFAFCFKNFTRRNFYVKI